MQNVTSAQSLSAIQALEVDLDVEAEVRGYKIAAMRGAFLACLFFTLRVVFFSVTGETPELGTSLFFGALALAIVVGALALAFKMAQQGRDEKGVPS